MTTVIVTGASAGIGRALAIAWGRRGANVVISARNAEPLAKVAREVEAAGGRAIVEVGDATDEAHRVRLVEAAVREGGLHVLVNNAGRGYYASALKVDLQQLRDLFELNVLAPLRLTQLAAPHLEASRGTVVMISSIAGVIAAPGYAAYSGSKFALEAIALAMRSELAAKGIRVVVVRPGPVDTDFRANALHADGEDTFRSPAANGQTPEDVAEVTLRAVDRGSAVVGTSNYVRFATAVAQGAPPVLRHVLRRMAEKASS